MKPSIGRIVIYNHPSGTQWPALVQRVEPNGLVGLVVFGPQPKVIFVEEDLMQGDGPRQWNWPPRVPDVPPV